MNQAANTGDHVSAVVERQGEVQHDAMIMGKFVMEVYDKDGNFKFRDEAPNIVTSIGRAWLLDRLNNTYTPVVGPYIGLISSVGWSAVAAADTMGSHAGWAEAGNGSNYPVWTTPATNARQTTAWSAASGTTTVSKALSSASSFTIGATGGTIKGCFLVIGTGAVATNNDGNGTLYSAGVFSGGDKVVGTGDVVNVSYTSSMTSS